ncbi:hypothetical protein SRABI83_03694 [Arthrobacter sp. Bi83]|nr:hypothetical protein SRABI83_03694 [Arthrobacter sp. Bi83]
MTVSGTTQVRRPASARAGGPRVPVTPWPRDPCPGDSGCARQAVAGSSRTSTAFETGVLLPSATLSSGTSTFASG